MMYSLRLLTCVFFTLTWLQSASQSLTDTITYQPSLIDFPNPERGFMQFTETTSGNYVPLDPVDLSTWRTLHQPWGADYAFHATLGYRGFYLEDFVNGPISATYLNAMQTDFNLARQAGVKLVVRFAYTRSDAPPYGDAPKHIVLQHIEQLKPVLQANADVIAVVNMGFIGAWGEGYYTDHFGLGSLSQQNWNDRIEVLQALLYALPTDRSVTVRVPQTKQKAVYGANAPPTVAPLTAQEAWQPTFKARIGFANDCFMSDATDSGTYINYDQNAPGGCDTCIFKPYWAEDSQFVPVGGETCIDWNPYTDCVGQAGGQAQHEMARMHFSYLNAGWNNAVNNDWVSGGCSDEIIQRLGYRFVLLQGQYPEESRAGEPIMVKITLKNTGFAAPFNPRKVRLLLRNTNTQGIWAVDLPENPRSWLPGPNVHVLEHTFCLPMDLPAGDYALLLHLPDPYPSIANRPEYAIRLANEGVWEEATGFNHLLHTLTVSGIANPPACSGESCFLPLNPGIPNAQFGATQTTGCAPFTVQLYNQSASCWEYNWILQGASPASSQDANPVVTYTTAGVYPVALTVTNLAGSATFTAQDYITVNALPVANFVAAAANDFTMAFTNASQGADSYIWDFGDGSGLSTETNPQHVFPGPGIYTVRLTALNGCGQVSQEQLVEVYCPFKEAQIQSDPVGAVCAGTTVSLSAIGTATGDFYWAFEDVGLAGENDPVLWLDSVYAGQQGQYRVEVVDTLGCSYQAFYELTVLPLPTVEIQPAGIVEIQYGSSATLEGVTNGHTWQWSNNSTTPQISVTDCGTYGLTVTHNNGCSRVALPVIVQVIPVVEWQNDTLFSSPAAQYQWQFNGQAIQGATLPYFVPAQSGTYQVETPCEPSGWVTSDPLEVIISGTNQVLAGQIRMYPNPAIKGEEALILVLDTMPDGEYRVVFSDLSGRKVQEFVVPGAVKSSINTTQLPAGTYMISVVQDGQLRAIGRWVKL